VLSGYAALVPTTTTNGYVGFSGQPDALAADWMAAGTLPRAGTITNLYVSVDHFASGTLSVTLFHNGSASPMGCTVTGSSSATTVLSCSATGSVTVAAGDTVSLQAANSGVAYSDLRWSANFA
jgi:hypothetical protein